MRRSAVRSFIRVGLLFLLCGAGGALVVSPEAVAAELLRPVDTPMEWAGGVEPEEPTVDLRRWVEVDRELLESAPEELTLTLPGGEEVRARRTGFERRGPGRMTWRGSLGSDPEPVVLTLHDGFVAGRLFHGGHSFSLAPVAGRHRLARLRPRAFPPCGGTPARAEALAPLAPSPSTVPATSGLAELPSPASQPPSPFPGGAGMGPTLDVLILYTPLARQWAGGPSAVQALAQSAVDLLTVGFENSGVNGRARLVRAVERDVVRGPSERMGRVLDRLTDDPEVGRMRNELRADLVSLWVDVTEDGSNLCGLAWGMRREWVGPQFAPAAFNMMRVQCAVDNMTFPHEVGHNLGGFHLPGDPAPSEASFPWSFGHFEEGRFRTIMAPSSSCPPTPALECARLPAFSNPQIRNEGRPTGIRNQRDNHRTFNQTVQIASFFRVGPADRPLAPEELSAQSPSATRVELSWTDPAVNETSFRVEQAEGDGPFVQVIGFLPRNSTGVTLEGLSPATRYRFRVRSHNAAGFSAYSDEAEVTTLSDLPPAPAGAAVEAVSETAVRLTWQPVPEGTIHVEIASPVAGFREVQVLDPGSFETVIEGLDPSTPYTVRLRASNLSGFSPYGEEVSVTTGGREGPCGEGGEALCLLDGRFEVRVAWRDPRSGDHDAGRALPVQGSEISGLFWFFGPENVELIVKMLDGTGLNGFFWHFYGGLSDVEYWISVRDTETGESRTFHNPPFEICGGADTQAFALDPGEANTGGSATAAVAGLRSEASAGVAEGSPLRLQDRFEIEVEWVDPRSGDRGVGHPLMELGTTETGFLWFFRPENIELVVKLLDGRALNGHFWLFWGGLSDVEYTIRVTDTEEGTETTFTNEAFEICGGADLGTL